MRKILMRGGISPLIPLRENDILVHDKIGSNSGNLLYANAVFRTLMTEETEVDIDNYGGEENRYTDKDIDRINEEYDAYIVPLADAFRPDFINKLNIYAKFFRKLKIPCIVIGVGIRAPYEPELNRKFPFDDAARNFVSAVLEKTAMVGVRGQITADYLKNLGFKEEKDYTVIGCPSMYTFGSKLEQRSLKLNPESKISINIKQDETPENVLEYFEGVFKNYKNSQCVAQLTREMSAIYTGKGLETLSFKDFYLQDKVKFFVSGASWFEDMRHIDLSMGARFHGNVAAILGGAPAVFVPIDARMRELIEYHDFAKLMPDDFQPDISLDELLSKVDLTSHLKRHEQNFDHFRDFLAFNRLDNIYSKNPDRVDAPYDSKLPPTAKAIRSINDCSKEEAICRCLDYQEGISAKQNRRIKTLEGKIKNEQKKISDVEKRLKNLEKENEELKAERGNLRKENKKLNDIVNSRTVKFARKVGKIVKRGQR